MAFLQTVQRRLTHQVQYHNIIYIEIGLTRLGEMEVPSLEQINSEPEFSAKYIEKTEFDELWSRYANVG